MRHFAPTPAEHRERKPKHVPRVQDLAEIGERVAVREAVRERAAADLAAAVAACGPGALAYGRWTYTDRTNPARVVVVYCCRRPGVSGWVGEATPWADELLGPPFLGFAPLGQAREAEPFGFGRRWDSYWTACEVPDVATAADLRAAAEKRQAKALAKQADEAAALAAWKARNVPASLFDDTPEESNP